MSKTYARWISALFCTFVFGLSVLSFCLPDRERSQEENRTLAQWPSYSWEAVKDGSFMTKVEAYFTDQFPLRDSWTTLQARCEQLLGKVEFNDVFLCEGETLISKVPVPEQALVDKNLGAVEALAGKTDIPVYLGLIPSAATIWGDKLPAGVENFDQAGLIEGLTGNTIPLYEHLNAHKDEEIFFRTDHHWSTLGAYYGYVAVMEGLGLTPLAQEDFAPWTLSDDFNGTLYSSSGIHWLTPDTLEAWVRDDGLSVTSWRTGTPQSGLLYDESYLEEKDKYSTFLGGNQPLCVIENANLDNGQKILLVRDSYSDALAPLLSQSFQEVHLLDLRYYRAPVWQYAAQADIDQIVVLYSVPNFITDVNVSLLYQ